MTSMRPDGDQPEPTAVAADETAEASAETSTETSAEPSVETSAEPSVETSAQTSTEPSVGTSTEEQATESVDLDQTRPFWLPAPATGADLPGATVPPVPPGPAPVDAAPSPWSFPPSSTSRGPYTPAVDPAESAPAPPASPWAPMAEPPLPNPRYASPAPYADPYADAAAGPYAGSYPPPSAPRRSRRTGWIVGGLAAAFSLALVAAMVGALVGAWVVRRDEAAPVSLPMPVAGSTDRATGSIPDVAAAALPSVVTVLVSGGDEGSSGTGSGFVVDAGGYVLTNNHVVADVGSDSTVRVVFSDGTSTSATIRGTDASYDLAVLKVARTGLKPLTLGDSAAVVVGDQVVAVGAPLGLDSTVTSGIVSALNRPVTPGNSENSQSYINAIQTDAAINPGNSGGPLLDMEGRVIGINSAIARIPGATTSGQSGSIGLGFAIPSNQARVTADQLIRSGKASHPIIGVLLDTEYTGPGARVAPSPRDGREPVTAGGPAARAGLEPGDVITAIDGKDVAEAAELVVAIRAKQVGETVTLTVKRAGVERRLELTLQGSTG